MAAAGAGAAWAVLIAGSSRGQGTGKRQLADPPFLTVIAFPGYTVTKPYHI